MKPPAFQYHDPKTLAEAVGLLGSLDNAKLLAGGQSLMPMLNMRFVLPDHVIDLNLVEGMSGIKETGGALEIGAMTRQRDLEFSDLVKAKCPLLHQAIMHIGHRQTRNRGTIGGSLCHLDPAAELVSVCAAHDATVSAAGPNGTREIAFADFPAGYLTPAIELNEIVTTIRIPLWPAGHKAAFIEFSRRHGDFAIVSAAALLQIDGGKITRASLTLGGVAVAPVRATEVEQAITGQAPSSELFAKLAKAAARSTRWPTSTPRRTTASTSPPCCRAARWRRPPGLPTTRRGTGRIRCKRRQFLAAAGAWWRLRLRCRSPRARSRRCRWSGFSAAPLADADQHLVPRVPPGPEGSRLRRGPERRDRISLCGQSIRSPAGAGGRTDSPAGAVMVANSLAGACGQGRNHDGADRLRDRRRSGQGRPCRELQSAGRQCYRRGVSFRRAWAKRLELLRQLVPKTIDDWHR